MEQTVYGLDQQLYDATVVAANGVARELGGSLATSGATTPRAAQVRFARLVEPNCVLTSAYLVDGESKARIRLLEFDPEDPKNPTEYLPDGQYLDAWCQNMTGVHLTGDVFPVEFRGDRWWIDGGSHTFTDVEVLGVEPTNESYECEIPSFYVVRTDVEPEINVVPSLKISIENADSFDPTVGERLTVYWDANRQTWTFPSLAESVPSSPEEPGACPCCDHSRCLDRGSVIACEGSGEATRNYYWDTSVALGYDFCGVTQAGWTLEHDSGCSWTGKEITCNGNKYNWNLLVDEDTFATITLIHAGTVGEDHPDPVPEIVYRSTRPFSGLCNNNFALHKGPSVKWIKDNPGWVPLTSTACLAVDPKTGICANCPDGISPRYMRVKVGTAASVNGGTCSAYNWDIVCVTPIEDTWETATGFDRIECPWYGESECFISSPITGAANYSTVASAEVGFLPAVPEFGVPAMVYAQITMRWLPPGSPIECTWNPRAYGYSSIFFKALFQMPRSELNCLGTNYLTTLFQQQHLAMAGEGNGSINPLPWLPKNCDMTGLFCTVEPTY